MSATTTLTPAVELDHIERVSAPRNYTRSPSSPASPVIDGDTGPPSHSATTVVERWNDSPQMTSRLAAAFFCFLVMGANDSAYGPLIPYLESYYTLSYTVVSLIFLSPFVGYVLSALLNNYIHHQLGQRGVAIICGACHTAAHATLALHPPYIALVFAFIVAGFGNGLADAAWNAWVGNLASSSELLGLLHAFYGVGGVMSPLIATTLITKANLPWYSFYYIMLGLAGVETIALACAFWDSSGAEYRRIHGTSENESETGLRRTLFKMPSAHVAWVAALFLLCYVGAEVALGGWIVVFMLRVRHGEPFASGISAVGFWLGITVGRVILGFVTPRLGVKVATTSYIAAAAALELIFWLVPQFYVSAVAVSLQGFFLGPLFPNVILVASKLLPRQHHVIVIGFASAFGGCGAAILPFVTGILAQARGPQVLQPIVLSLLAVMLGIWFCFPRVGRKTE